MPMWRVRRNQHSLYRLEYHLILTTKYRKRCITEEMYQYLYQETIRLMTGWNIEVMEMSYEPDQGTRRALCPAGMYTC